MDLIKSSEAFCVADSLITHFDALLDLLVLPYHRAIQAHCISGKKTCLFQGHNAEHLDVLDALEVA